jgi:hypothetical protein
MAQHFSHSRMEYGKDKQGKDILIKDGKFQVMMQWEKHYMQACIDALHPFGDVLEVGFGLGYSSERIQSYHPKSHTIIEYHPEVAKHARKWAKNYPNVMIVEDTWQNALSKLGVYDAIFFDDYPLQSEEELKKMEEEANHSRLLLKKAERVLKEIEEKLPFINEIQYSDEDLRGLMQQVPSKQLKQFARFLTELCERKQITMKQLLGILDELVVKEKITPGEKKEILKSSSKVKASRPDERLFSFLKQCLVSHMRKNSRFSCFLSSPVSKYQDEKFVNEIITNPDLDYHEEEIAVEVPKNCSYFSGDRALVITITKVR